jgi:hypothetical protein
LELLDEFRAVLNRVRDLPFCRRRIPFKIDHSRSHRLIVLAKPAPVSIRSVYLDLPESDRHALMSDFISLVQELYKHKIAYPLHNFFRSFSVIDRGDQRRLRYACFLHRFCPASFSSRWLQDHSDWDAQRDYAIDLIRYHWGIMEVCRACLHRDEMW